MTDGTNELRLFQELRLAPWKDSDYTKIQGHLAMLYVTDKTSAESYQRRYDEKMKAYIERRNAELGVKPVAVEPVKVETTEEKPKKLSPKKHAKHV